MMDRHLATELGNVQATLDDVDGEALTSWWRDSAISTSPWWCSPGMPPTASRASSSTSWRCFGRRVTRLGGNEVAVRRDVSLLSESTTVVVIDVRRYDHWVLDTVAAARDTGDVDRGADRQLSLAARRQRRPHVRAVGRIGRAVRQPRRHARALEPVVTEVAGRLRSSASSRLDRVEDAWRRGVPARSPNRERPAVDSLDLVTANETRRRRTFAIISHPDAGKTTLTEKFLLYAGAVGEAGAVKARPGRRSTTSDWMEMEQKRGISISSTALQFPFRDHVLNLLDTPGHRDFSEDTYRVLAAVDAVVMVLDSAKGIEPQTLKLFEVCRSRGLPVLTFLNKFDRPGRDPLELLDEIEKQIDLRPTPATWPVGLPGEFHGVIDRRTGRFIRFTRTTRGSAIAPEEDDRRRAGSGGGGERVVAARSTSAACSMRSAPTSTRCRSWRGSRRRCSSARRSPTSVCATSSRRSSTSRRPPSPRLDIDGVPRPIDSPCSAFVFKVQANMDRSHRDRIAFVRICSGRFERGMVLTSARTGKPFATKYASTVFGAERSTVDVAFPGDVVGLVNATGLNIGDSLYDGDPVEFPPIPRFSPEVFASARPLDSGRFKQFRRGLAQLDEEGVVQVLRDPDMGDSAPVLAAVGQLQFEVFANRLDVEFGAPIEVLSAPYEAIRLTDATIGRSAPPDRRDPDPGAR